MFDSPVLFPAVALGAVGWLLPPSSALLRRTMRLDSWGLNELLGKRMLRIAAVLG